MGEWRYSDRICMVLVCVVVSCNWLNWSASLPRAEGKFQNAPMCLKDFENRFRMCASLHVSIRMTRPQHAWKSRVSEVSRVQSLKSSSGLAEVWHVDTMWTTKKWHEDPIEVQHSADILSFWHVNIDYAWLCRCAFAELLPRRNTTTRLCQAMPGHLPWPEAKTFTLPGGEVVWCDGEIPFWSIREQFWKHQKQNRKRIETEQKHPDALQHWIHDGSSTCKSNEGAAVLTPTNYVFSML